MKQILKFFAFITLCRSLVRMSKLDTVHYEVTANQMTQTRAAIYILGGTSEQLVKQHAKLIEKVKQLEQRRVDLESHNSLLVLEINEWLNLKKSKL